MKKLYCLFLLSILCGCAGAKIVKTTLNPLGGTVEYKNGNYVREKSRGMALEEMQKFCQGNYQIVKEEFNPDVFSIQISGTYYTPDKANNMYIHFTCQK